VPCVRAARISMQAWQGRVNSLKAWYPAPVRASVCLSFRLRMCGECPFLLCPASILQRQRVSVGLSFRLRIGGECDGVLLRCPLSSPFYGAGQRVLDFRPCCGRTGFALSVPRWILMPSKYQQHWVRYSALGIGSTWVAAFIYRCVGCRRLAMPAPSTGPCTSEACRCRTLSPTPLKRMGYAWSCLACRIGHCVPVWQPFTGSSFR
jgi:hypothetical protein